MFKRNLSKSRFLSGVQCPKRLYRDIHSSDAGAAPDAAIESRFRTGHLLGRLAQQVFPGGKDATPEVPRSYGPAIENTRVWLEAGVPTIYEATFSAHGAFAALDILHRKDNEWWAVEVKSNTRVEEQHRWDAAFQYWVMTAAGYRPDRMFIMHPDPNYILDTEVVNPHGLFTLTDITEDVIGRQTWVQEKKDNLATLLAAGQEPEQNIGPHCMKPYVCPHKDHCHLHIPTPSVFDLYKLQKRKAYNLHDQGIIGLDKLPVDYPLTALQKIQRDSLLRNRPYFNADALRKYLGKLTGPLHFFDVETIAPAVPMVRGMSPYTKLVFQFSLHVTRLDGTMLKHHEFLADETDIASAAGRNVDPRVLLIEKMKTSFLDTGSIVVFNQTFERNQLHELALAFPAETKFLKGLESRIVDLLEPFQKGWCYLPAMLGSFSFKSVLPAIAPHLAYDDLTIRDGNDASETFYQMVMGTYTGDHNAAKGNLKDYCRRDTEGMIPVYQYLRGLA